MSLADKAKFWAIIAHKDANHSYDARPYSYHLEHVVAVAKKYIYIIPPFDQEIVIAAAWAHDTIEDTRKTFNDVKDELGEEVAEIVYALTNEKGRTRKDRANGKYYNGIRITPYATFIKICDRIANMEHSISVGSKMTLIYAKEFDEFDTELNDGRYPPMWEYLKRLVLISKTATNEQSTK